MTLAVLALIAAIPRAFGAPASEAAALKADVAAAVGSNDPWTAIRLADKWADIPGLAGEEKADALIESALARAQVGDYAGAEEALERALKARPGDAAAAYLLALATRDRPERALARAEDSARLAASPPRRAAAYRLAAEIRRDLGDDAGAREDLARSLELAPGDLDALVLMAALQRDDAPAAARYARAACAAADAQPSWRRAAALRVCARALSDSRDYSGAMAALGRALALDPDDVDTLRAMLQIKRLSPAQELPEPAAAVAGRPVSAQEARRALQRDPDDLEAMRVLVEAERAARRPRRAAELADRLSAALRTAPDWQRVDGWRLSARLWIELGSFAKAKASIRRADDLESNSIATEKLTALNEHAYHEASIAGGYRAVAQLRLDLGQPAEARAALERGLELLPDNLDLLQQTVELELATRTAAEALPYAEKLVAEARRAPAGPSGKKRGRDKDELLSSARAESEADLRNAERTLQRVRDALGREPAAQAATPPSPRARQCLASSSVETLLSSYKRKWQPRDIPDFPALFSQLVLYNLSGALRAGDARRCGGSALVTDPVPGKRGPISIAGICEDMYASLAMTKAAVSKSPDFIDVCLRSVSATRAVKPEDVNAVCGILAADGGRPAEAAAKIERFHPVLRLDREADFAAVLAGMEGLASEETCAKYSLEPENWEKCLAAPRFRKAFRAGDAELCGESDLCRAMMGEKDAGRRYARRAVEFFCAVKTP